MSIGLATKGIIFQVGLGGGGTNVYVPVVKPSASTEAVGEMDLYTVSEDSRLRMEIIKPSIGAKDFKPFVKVE